ncbi:hypothetical protein CXG81DRAFT_20271 [Caulochytrium protostelioides]|uniref:Uncharacterized protein n=1 Tax=Caulochytrium protostelioides TaxID=1555241 RepID=A0A4P9X3R7_9FUNG|nr:hypothetical protein CXG81DRAFT_20271 [Caulochytrium protostelioides]|eukprot:RKO99672.1 hypothetical protein CXG81DRAFT_20271 [Caulochytrium protostelioides]
MPLAPTPTPTPTPSRARRVAASLASEPDAIHGSRPSIPAPSANGGGEGVNRVDGDRQPSAADAVDAVDAVNAAFHAVAALMRPAFVGQAGQDFRLAGAAAAAAAAAPAAAAAAAAGAHTTDADAGAALAKSRRMTPMTGPPANDRPATAIGSDTGTGFEHPAAEGRMASPPGPARPPARAVAAAPPVAARARACRSGRPVRRGIPVLVKPGLPRCRPESSTAKYTFRSGLPAPAGHGIRQGRQGRARQHAECSAQLGEARRSEAIRHVASDRRMFRRMDPAGRGIAPPPGVRRRRQRRLLATRTTPTIKAPEARSPSSRSAVVDPPTRRRPRVPRQDRRPPPSTGRLHGRRRRRHRGADGPPIAERRAPHHRIASCAIVAARCPRKPESSRDPAIVGRPVLAGSPPRPGRRTARCGPGRSAPIADDPTEDDASLASSAGKWCQPIQRLYLYISRSSGGPSDR